MESRKLRLLDVGGGIYTGLNEAFVFDAENRSGSFDPVSYPALAVGSAGRLFVTWTQPTANDRQSVLIRGRIKTS